MPTSHSEAPISADPDVPIVRIVRDFDAPAELLMRAHLDAELFCRWVGPDGMETETVDWDPTTGGRWRYVARRDGNEYWFRGCFHEVGERRIVQTFTSRWSTASRTATSGSRAACRQASTRATPSSMP